MMAASDRDVGELKGRVDGLSERLDRLEPKIDLLLAFMASNKGAWKALSVVAGASSILGGALAWLAEHGIKGLLK